MTTVEDIRGMLRAGVRMNTAEWMVQSEEVRAMYVRAGRMNAAEDACAIARASMGPEGYAAVFAEIDGGTLATALVLQEAVEEATK